MILVATFITALFVLWLFYLDRDKDVRTSWTLWIPTLWFGILCSRPVSFWIHPQQGTDYVDRFTEGSPVDASFYGLLIIAGLLVLNMRAQHVKRVLQANIPILLYFFFCAISIAWADEPMISFKRWIKAIGDLIMVLVVMTDTNPLEAIKRLYTRAGFILLPMSVLFIRFYPALGTTYDPVSHVTMYTGVATFKNLLGVLCMVCGLGSLWIFIGAYEDRAMPNRTRHLVAHGINLLLALGLVLRADSMTSLSSFALAGAVMVGSAQKWVKRRPAILIAMVVAVVGIASFALFMDSGGSLLQSIGRNPTLTGRTKIWEAVLAQPINPLVGAGFESFWMGSRMQSVWDMSQYGIQQAHNGYLELYLNLGWIGIALLGALIITGYRNALPMYRIDPQFGRMRFGFITAAVVYGFTEAGFRMMSPDWFAFLLALILLPPASEEQPVTRASFIVHRAKERPEVRILQ